MDKYYRKTIKYNKNYLEFQSLEWTDTDEYIETEDKYKYIINVFGITEEGYSVCLSIQEFTPFFYIKVPKIFNLKTFLSVFFGKFKIKGTDDWQDIRDFMIIKSCKIFQKKDFYGFQGDEEYNFLRLVFDNSQALSRAISVINQHNNGIKSIKGYEKIKFPLYETKLDNVLRFIHIKQLKTSGWITVKDISVINFNKKSNCQIEAEVNWKNVDNLDKETNAPILQASFDIEVFNEDNSFDPYIKENVITHIATTFKRFGIDNKDCWFKHIICLKSCSKIEEENTYMEVYEKEEDVLLSWKRLILKTDPDIFYHYNGDWFDFHYLYSRAKLLKIDDDFLYLGKLKNVRNELKETSFGSSAYGFSRYRRLTLVGRINFDVLIYIKRTLKEESYKLDYISKKYVNASKNPITPHQMFEYFKEGDPDKLRLVAKYCLQDTVLPQLLVDKFMILQSQISMSNICYVPIKYLIERGQMIKVFSQILKETSKRGYLVPTLKSEDTDTFQGAYVLEPVKGAYFQPITTLDFASLYPSIIRSHNLCYSTIVLNKKYDNLENFEYELAEWENDKGEKFSYKYAQNVKGVLPDLLEELAKSRKYYKKLMNEATDDFSREVYNQNQLAVKVSMNSMYGFLAAPMLCCKPIASTVTFWGRDMLEKTKKFVETNYPKSKVVYGDSVVGDTPLLLRDLDTGKISIKTIESLSNNWKPYEEFKKFDTNRKDKEQSSTNYQIWSDDGWNDIKRVIRHKTIKNIYRVSTKTGIVDVTEDHSLVNSKGVLVKPKDCKKEDKLLHSYPTNFLEYETDIDKREAFIYGVFAKNGNIINNKWEITVKDKEILNIIGNTISNVELDIVFDVIKDGNMYKIYAKNENEYLTEKYRNLFYQNKYVRIIPESILNNSYDIKGYFITGYLVENFDCKTTKNAVLDIDIDINFGKSFVSGMFYLLKSLGYKINIYENLSKNSYSISCGSSKKLYNSGLYTINLGKCDSETYVYDLETENGRFNAGIGDIIVKNTDSVLVSFNTPSLDKYLQLINNNKVEDKEEVKLYKTKCIEEAMEIGKKSANEATKLFKYPIQLEFEKVFCPYFLLSKKRYCGDLYSENSKKFKFKNSGLVLTRRDNFQLLKEVYQNVLDIIKNTEENSNYKMEIIEYIQDIVNKINNNEIPIEKLIISKSIKENYKNKNIPHVFLQRKLQDRNPADAPKTNDRVPYLFIDPVLVPESKNGKKKIAQYLKVEDPEYVKKHGLSLDKEYYIKFMSNPLCEILSLFIKDPQWLFEKN